MPPANLLADKVCVITGASKGLGLTLSEALVAQGAKVAMLARGASELHDAAAMLGEAALPVLCDVAVAASVNAAFAKVADHFGRIDVLVANAATMVIARVEDVTDEQVARQLNVNVAGSIFCARAAIPHLRAAGGGDILFIGSEGSQVVFPFLSMYAATKLAIEALAAGLREELRDQRTRVTTVRLGRTEGSNLRAGNAPEAVTAFVQDMQAGGYFLQAGEEMSRTTMAQMIVALLNLPPDVNIDLVYPRGRRSSVNR